MGFIYRMLKAGRWVWLGLGLAIALYSSPIIGFNFETGGQTLSAIAAAPSPQLPDWIEEISPTGKAEPLTQIRIRFKEPLIPLEQLESETQQTLLQQFELTPALAGQFRFLTPRMVGFQADKALPDATQIKVTLKAGLADLKQHQLAQDFAWDFNTEPVDLTSFRGQIEVNPPSFRGKTEIETISLNPELDLTANTELDLSSLQQSARLISERTQREIPLRAILKQDDWSNPPDPERQSFEEALYPGSRERHYLLIPQQTLEKATNYRLEILPGLRPARGNMASATTFKGQLKTYEPLVYQKLAFGEQLDSIGVQPTGASVRFVKGTPQLQFNNRLDAESINANITVSPAPLAVEPKVRILGNAISFNPWMFEPNTAYTLTVGANLKDEFGQTLGKPITVAYQSGDVAPSFSAQSRDLRIFPAGTNLPLNFSAVNLPDATYQAAYRVLKPTDLIYSNENTYSKNGIPGLLPEAKTWKRFRLPNPTLNKIQNVALPLREKLGGATGMVAYGIKARTYQYRVNMQEEWQEPTFFGLVQFTNLGVFAQRFPQGGLVRVHHLDDGSAVQGATVEVYPDLVGETRKGDRPCATGITDRTGTLTLGADVFRECAKRQGDPTEPSSVLIVAREQKDWAFVRLDNDNYGYGIEPRWGANGLKPESRGIIFSDRKLYQPGETAWFTGVAYSLQEGILKQNKQVPYQLTLEDQMGLKTDLGRQTTNEFGTFSLKLDLPLAQPLGAYTLRAKAANGLEITGDFQVAEFKPSNFKVALTLDREIATPKQTVNASAQSKYLFGSPVTGSPVTFTVNPAPTTFSPKDWSTFTFGRQWFWPEEQPSVISVINDAPRTDSTLDAQGQGNLPIEVAADLPYPMTYQISAEVRDVSNLAVADSKTFTALPSDRLIGLQSDFAADAGKPFPLEVIVTNPTGQAIAGERVRVELQEMKYSSVAQVGDDRQTVKHQVEYKTVATEEVTSAASPQVVRLTPPQSGSYRIRANFATAKDDKTATDRQIWATGAETASWGDRYRNNRLELKLEREQYAPGDTATVLVQSPYPEADLYLSVVRHKVLYQRIVAVKGSAVRVQVPITSEMLPNAAVEAILVRRGQPLSQVKPGTVKDLVRIGFATFDLSLKEKTLTVGISPTLPTVAPRGGQTVHLTLKDPQGQPVKGQFAVMVVNEAVLQLTGYRVPNLLETVYAKQDISTRFRDNRSDVVLEALIPEKDWVSGPISPHPIRGLGGDENEWKFPAGADRTLIRKDFRALAYYNGSVLTDNQGQASVTFKLPDDLTTWRVMAVAMDGNLRFGTRDATFITTKPLISNPILPQFARPGDRFEAGLSVTNTTGQVGTLNISGTLSGMAKLESSGKIQTPAEKTTQAYRFPIVALQPGKATVQFSTQLGKETDAFMVPLEVKPYAVTEQVIETGTTNTQVKIPLNIGSNVEPNVGGLDISLASTLIPELMAPAKQVFQADQIPFLEPAASQLAIAAHLKTLSQQYGQIFPGFDPTAQAKTALQQLQELQKSDGGFAAWPGQETSDPFVSSYAAQSLAQAQAAGIAVKPDLLNAAQRYLDKILVNPGSFDFCKTELCKAQIRLNALIALAEFGDLRNTFVSNIYTLRTQLDTATQFKLARHLSRLPNRQTEAAALTQQLQQTLAQTGRTATVNLPQSWGWLSSRTAAQAEALRLLIERKTSAEIQDRALRGLLTLRREGTWGSTYDNAQALAALVAYSKQQPTPPQFKAIAELANKTLVSQTFAGYQKTNVTQTVPMAELPRGQNDLVLQKTGEGTLHYLMAYRYQLQGNQPGRLNGLRVTRTIRPANQNKVLHRIGLTSPAQPLSLAVGEVFDIGLEIIADHPVDHVIITDPLPAGLEAVDTTFQTSAPYIQARGDSWQLDYQTIYKDKIMAYGDRLEAGVYTLHYLVRAVTPGTFQWPGAEAHLQYAPEELGRSGAAEVKLG
jgi:alpha-2-macroglobulin